MKRVILVWLLCCCSPLWAAEQKTDQMEDVVVTATRTSSDLQHVGGASVTVITADDIEARHLASVVDVLNTVPGLQIDTSGGLGTMSKVRIRGAHTKDTLLLIDGVAVNDSSDGNRGADFSNISLDNVERIEVVRGAMSVLYGSNATAGVINIITKSGAEKTHGYVGGETGTYNTYKVYGGVAGSVGISDFSLALSQLTSDGYSLANADNNDIPHAGNTAENDEWENTTFSGKIVLNLSSATSLTAVLRTVDAEMDSDDWNQSGYAGDRIDTDPVQWWLVSATPDGLKEARTDTNRLFGKLNLHNRLLDGKIVSDLDYKYSRQERDTYNNDGDNTDDYLGLSEEWNWQGTFQVVPYDYITVGVGLLNEDISSVGSYSGVTREDAETMSCWLQNQLLVGNFDVVAGVRYDDHDRFGGKATWRLAPAYHVESTGTTIRTSYATGFRTPSLFELYSNVGNSDLDPEKSKSFDFGIDQSLFDDRLSCGITYFWSEFEDRIGYDTVNTITGFYQIDGESESEGVEIFSKWQIVDTLLLSADYTYTDTKKHDGSRKERTPLNKVHIGVHYTFMAAASVNVDGYWYDERDTSAYAYDAHGNQVTTMDDYFLVNIAAHYDLTDMLRIYARVDNLFDEHYEEAWSYAVPGQSFYAGVKLTF